MQKEVYDLIHLCWCTFQMGAGLPYHFPPTEEDKRMMDYAIDDILSNPNITPQELHSTWVMAKEKGGWVYGEEKDNEKKTHPSLVPWEKLFPIEQAKDIFTILSTKEVLKAFKYIQ